MESIRYFSPVDNEKCACKVDLCGSGQGSVADCCK